MRPQREKKWQDLSRLAGNGCGKTLTIPGLDGRGRASMGLKRLREAAGDFQKVLELDPAHAEALWELQQLELELASP